jgi:tetratricopeptide (TPR) repeat protein
MADEAGFYLDCWRPALDPLAPDVQSRLHVSYAFSELGLWDDALRVQREVTAALTRDDREDPDALRELARLYLRVGQPREAQETIRYARRQLPAARSDLRFDLLDGLAAHALGNVDGALAAWRRAEREPAVQAEARVRTAMLLADTGRCDPARPVLEQFAVGDAALATDEVDLADARLSIARCHLDQARFEPALALSMMTAADSAGTLWAEQASWNAGVALARLPDAPLPEGPAAPPAPWTLAIGELRRVAEVERRVDKVRRRTRP